MKCILCNKKKASYGKIYQEATHCKSCMLGGQINVLIKRCETCDKRIKKSENFCSTCLLSSTKSSAHDEILHMQQPNTCTETPDDQQEIWKNKQQLIREHISENVDDIICDNNIEIIVEKYVSSEHGSSDEQVVAPTMDDIDDSKLNELVLDELDDLDPDEEFNKEMLLNSDDDIESMIDWLRLLKLRKLVMMM